MPKLSFKQDFIRQIKMLMIRCATDGKYHRVSKDLWAAFEEILAELSKPRTNWSLVAALCGVKSYITDRAKGRDGEVHHFWSKLHGMDGPYRVLDRLAHQAAYRASTLPSGMVEYIGTDTGIVKREADLSGDSPTLNLMRQEWQWIMDHSRPE